MVTCATYLQSVEVDVNVVVLVETVEVSVRRFTAT